MTPRARIFLLLFLALAGPAGAWETHLAPDGQPQRWVFDGPGPLQVTLVDPPAGLRLAPGSDLRRAITFAAEAWQAVESAHVPVRYAGQIPQRALQPPDVLVQFDTGPQFPAGQNAAGFTDLTVQGHQVVSARIHLNAAGFDWATDGSLAALDVQSIVEHELGHVLGLAHPCGDLDTQTPSCTALSAPVRKELEQDVMFPSITPGPRRLLSFDDVQGITALQPAAHPPEVAPLPIALQPSCMELAGPAEGAREVRLTVVRAPVPLALELLDQDQVATRVPLAGQPAGGLTGSVPAAALAGKGTLDARLVADSGKGGVLFDALTVASSCKARGCSSSGGSVLALLPLLFFRRRRKLALPLLVFSLSAPAFAYKRSVNTGQVVIWWSTRGHSFQIDAQGTPDVPGLAAFTAIRRSLQTWADITCSDLAFSEEGLSQNPKARVVGYFPGQTNHNLILFRTRRCGNGSDGGVVPPGDACLKQGGCSNLYDCWNHGDGVIATTTTTSNKFTGQISDSDIEVNDAPDSSGNKFVFTAVDGLPCTDPNQTGCVRVDVQNTITHEAGHTIGLDHTPDPNATMYASAPMGETSKRVLGADDVQGVCDIYPRGQRTVTGNDPITLTPAGSSNGGCGSMQGGPEAALGALALLLRRRRRLQRRA